MFAIAIAMSAGVGAAWLLADSRSPFENPLEELYLQLDEDTHFATDYSDRAFALLRVGDPEAKVRELLGQPIEEYGFGQDTVLQYSVSPTSRSFRQRTIVIRDGQVAEILAGLYLD
jgi:hypothetical protein